MTPDSGYMLQQLESRRALAIKVWNQGKEKQDFGRTAAVERKTGIKSSQRN